MNKAILKGRLGADPELRYTKAGQPVVNFNLATNERWTDKDGNKTERTQWHRIVFFGNRADTIAKYLYKGSQVLVEGRIQTRKYEDSNGVQRQSTEILGQNFEFCDPRKASDGFASDETVVGDEAVTEQQVVEGAQADLDEAPF